MEVSNGSLKVHQIVEYMKEQEFPFDTHDDPDEVLAFYGVDSNLSFAERQLLVSEVRRLEEQSQTSEIARIVLNEWDWQIE